MRCHHLDLKMMHCHQVNEYSFFILSVQVITCHLHDVNSVKHATKLQFLFACFGVQLIQFQMLLGHKKVYMFNPVFWLRKSLVFR